MENYHKLGNLVIWWFCVHVNNSKLFTIPMISLWWMRLWMKSWTIYLFWIFATLKERKTKDMKGTKGLFWGKKMGPKSPRCEGKKSKVMFDLVYKKGFNLCTYGCRRPRWWNTRLLVTKRLIKTKCHTIWIAIKLNFDWNVASLSKQRENKRCT
jgi:hypothetical protein